MSHRPADYANRMLNDRQTRAGQGYAGRLPPGTPGVRYWTTPDGHTHYDASEYYYGRASATATTTRPTTQRAPVARQAPPPKPSYSYVPLRAGLVGAHLLSAAESAYRMACRELGLDGPAVRWLVRARAGATSALITRDKPICGFYDEQTETIHIRADQDEEGVFATVAHEMAHHAQHRRGYGDFDERAATDFETHLKEIRDRPIAGLLVYR